MLQSLFIENFVLIDHLEIDFHPKMSVFTGETGAGKSIIIGALSLALGSRADNKSIGPFSQQTEIIAEFNVAGNTSAQKWLQEQDLQHVTKDDDVISTDTLIIRRTFNQQGRSKQWVNGRPTPSGLVKELGQNLMQIHGQHDQIKLLNNRNQLNILDQSGDYELLIKQTAEAAKEIESIDQKINDVIDAGSMSREQVQLLQYQFDELEQLDLAETEYETLHTALKTAAHAHELIQNIDESLQSISEADMSIENQLAKTINQLKHANGHDFTSVCQMLEESLININEAQHELRIVSDGIDSNPERLAGIENRIEEINQVARKQQVMPELLFQHHADLATSLKTHADLTKNKTHLDQKLNEALEKYRGCALNLSAKRAKAAKTLAAHITKMTQDLGLPEADFSITVTHQTDARPNPLGNDHIEFMIAANKGQHIQPLNKTASGGELSRISLAIEVSTQKMNHRTNSPRQAFIFDEVDTGIGGATAEKVGKIMQQLSVHNQVFAVTHLPQVAGHAHDHILVSKSSQGKYTTSRIDHLNEAQRIQELARMSGGQNITAATLAQAKEFLKTGS